MLSSYIAALAAASLSGIALAGVAQPAEAGILHARDSKPGFPYDKATTPSCSFWYDNDGSMSCQDVVSVFGIPMDKFLSWNPSVTPRCGNFMVSRSYCMEATGEPTPTTTTTTITSVTSVTSSSPPVEPTTSTTTKPSNGIETPAPVQPDIVSNCNKFYWVKKGENCNAITSENGIPLDDFLSWNPKAGQQCAGLWADTYACVSVIGYKPSPTKPSNGVETPSPLQPSMVGDCNKFYYVNRGDTCADIAGSHGISVADFASWNPKVGADCTGLWADAYACISTIGHELGTPTGPSNGIETPKPTQPDITNACNKFYFAKAGQSCVSIASEGGITLADFVNWNAKVGNDCSGLWANANACVGVIGFYDFNDGTSNGWSTIDGTYDTKSKALVAGNPGKAVLKVPFTDFIYKAEVTLPSSTGNAGLIFRASNVGAGADNYRGYYIGISADPGGYVVLGRADNNWNELNRIPLNILPGQTCLIKVIALADEISVYINDMGAPKLTVRDNAYRSGINGMRSFNNGATFDNVELSPIVYDNFDKNMIGWKIYDGVFDAGSKELVASNVFSGKAVLDTTFEDIIMEADITLPESGSGNGGFIFRATSLGTGPDAYNGYYAGIGTDGIVTLGQANGSWKQLRTAAMDIRAGQKYHMQIRAIGDSLDVYVNDMGMPKISVKDGSFKRGVTGVRVFRTGAKVDNYRVQKR